MAAGCGHSHCQQGRFIASSRCWDPNSVYQDRWLGDRHFRLKVNIQPRKMKLENIRNEPSGPVPWFLQSGRVSVMTAPGVSPGGLGCHIRQQPGWSGKGPVTLASLNNCTIPVIHEWTEPLGSLLVFLPVPPLRLMGSRSVFTSLCWNYNSLLFILNVPLLNT